MKKFLAIALILCSVLSQAESYPIGGGGGGGGVSGVGSFSGSSQTNGATISGSTITFGPADGTNPGMVSTGAQTFAGVKTFSSAPILSANTAHGAVILNSSKAVATVAPGNNGSVLSSNGTDWTSVLPGALFDPTASGTVINQFEDFDSFSAVASSNTYTYGPLHLIFSGTNALNGPSSSEKNRYGIISTTISGTNSSGYFGSVENAIYPGVNTYTYASSFQIGSNIPSGAGNSWVASWGYLDSYPNASQNGAYFKMNYLSPNFICETFISGATSDTDSGVAYAANTWYNFRIVLNTTNSLFYINGNLVCTKSLPNGGGSAANLGPFATFTNQTGSGVTIRHDWLFMQTILGSSRGTF